MIIHNHIEDKALSEYFFVEGLIDIDSKYFINEIKKGVEKEDNNNFKTNVRDKVTSYKYFNYDKKFINILEKFSNYIESRCKTNLYGLIDSWGYCVDTNNKTLFHDHKYCVWSGVIYLNSHSQYLKFPGINKKIKPEKGKFVLFSSFLKHGTERHDSKETKWGISFNMAPDIFNTKKDKND